jgi:hypothetical protein
MYLDSLLRLQRHREKIGAGLAGPQCHSWTKGADVRLMEQSPFFLLKLRSNPALAAKPKLVRDTLGPFPYPTPSFAFVLANKGFRCRTIFFLAPMPMPALR